MDGIDRVDIIHKDSVVNEEITKGENFVEVPIHNGPIEGPLSKGQPM